jgi:hypothetical protein
MEYVPTFMKTLKTKSTATYMYVYKYIKIIWKNTPQRCQKVLHQERRTKGPVYHSRHFILED